MKLIFAHDHIFYEYDDIYYSQGGLSKLALERYRKISNNFTILSRQKKIESYNQNLTISSSKNDNFVSIPNFKSISDFHKIISAKKIIENQIAESDMVIARIPSSIGNIAVEAAIKFNIPYLIELVACPWDSYWNYGLKGKIIAPYSYLKTRAMVRNSKFTLYVTNEFLQKRYPTKGSSVNCSNVQLTNIDSKNLSRRHEKILSYEPNKCLIIGTTAAINVKYKGQQFIMKALSELKKSGKTNFKYQLVGGGDKERLLRLAIKYEIEDQVEFLGVKTNIEVHEWLKTIDIYTQPSKQEGLPRALIEAMSNGLPCFGANTAGIPELLGSNYIFTNGKNNIKEIMGILNSFSKISMIEQSTINFNNSLEYKEEIISKRRNDFFNEFLNSNSLREVKQKRI